MPLSCWKRKRLWMNVLSLDGLVLILLHALGQFSFHLRKLIKGMLWMLQNFSVPSVRSYSVCWRWLIGWQNFLMPCSGFWVILLKVSLVCWVTEVCDAQWWVCMSLWKVWWVFICLLVAEKCFLLHSSGSLSVFVLGMTLNCLVAGLLRAGRMWI